MSGAVARAKAGKELNDFNMEGKHKRPEDSFAAMYKKDKAPKNNSKQQTTSSKGNSSNSSKTGKPEGQKSRVRYQAPTLVASLIFASARCRNQISSIFNQHSFGSKESVSVALMSKLISHNLDKK